MLKRVHHINFLVSDLEDAIQRYESALGVEVSYREQLPERGVKTARFRIGETWIVLVCPTDLECAPGQHLARHGEGFFLLSFEVDDLSRAADSIRTAGGETSTSGPRQGLADWRVMDLDPVSFRGANLPLVETGEA